MGACFKNDGRTAQLKTPLLVSALSVEPEKKREEQVSSCLKKEMN